MTTTTVITRTTTTTTRKKKSNCNSNSTEKSNSTIKSQKMYLEFTASLPLYAFSNWSPSVHYFASFLVLACELGLLPWLLPARTSRSLSPMSPPRGALVVLPRPVLVLLWTSLYTTVPGSRCTLPQGRTSTLLVIAITILCCRYYNNN